MQRAAKSRSLRGGSSEGGLQWSGTRPYSSTTTFIVKIPNMVQLHTEANMCHLPGDRGITCSMGGFTICTVLLEGHVETYLFEAIQNDFGKLSVRNSEFVLQAPYNSEILNSSLHFLFHYHNPPYNVFPT